MRRIVEAVLIEDQGVGERADLQQPSRIAREARDLQPEFAASLRGTAKRAFGFRALGKMGARGHRSAMAEMFGVKLSGFLAWWLGRTIYLMKLPGLDRKLRVAVDWTLDLLLAPDIV